MAGKLTRVNVDSPMSCESKRLRYTPHLHYLFFMMKQHTSSLNIVCDGLRGITTEPTGMCMAVPGSCCS